MNSVWLRDGLSKSTQEKSISGFNPIFKSGIENCIDHNLGLDLVRDLYIKGEQAVMDHDFDVHMLISNNGKKRPRRENIISSDENDEESLMARNRRILETKFFLSATAKRHANRSQ